MINIMKTCPRNTHILMKLEKLKNIYSVENVYISLDFVQNFDCGYTLELQQDGSNEYPIYALEQT